MLGREEKKKNQSLGSIITQDDNCLTIYSSKLSSRAKSNDWHFRRATQVIELY